MHSPAIDPDGSTIAFAEAVAGGMARLRILDRVSEDSFVLKNSDGRDLPIVAVQVFFSADGRFILFTDGDALDVDQPYHQVALYDRRTRTYDIVSRNNQGDLAQWYAYPGGIFLDGRHIYFWSSSPNLPDADSNGSGRTPVQARYGNGCHS